MISAPRADRDFNSFTQVLPRDRCASERGCSNRCVLEVDSVAKIAGTKRCRGDARGAPMSLVGSGQIAELCVDVAELSGRPTKDRGGRRPPCGASL